jgi:hypothetical protein
VKAPAARRRAAVETDYGGSTVLEVLCVASTVGFLVPEESGEAGWRKIRNPTFEIPLDGWAALLIPNS